MPEESKTLKSRVVITVFRIRSSSLTMNSTEDVAAHSILTLHNAACKFILGWFYQRKNRQRIKIQIESS